MNRNKAAFLLVAINVMLVAFILFREAGVDPAKAFEGKSWAAPAPGTPSRADQRRTEITDVAEQFAPSVVSIGAKRTSYYVDQFASFFRNYNILSRDEKVPYMGSGVIIDSDGLIVTNYHVVENAKDVFVTLVDGREIPGKVVDADTLLDIALIQVEAKNLPAAKLGDSNNALVGEWVVAMGNPFGNVIGDPTPTVTVGVISALKRDFRPNQEIQRVYQDMIQTDAAINPGNSGGALINTQGELVGINTFIVSKSGGAEGIGFAIPVNRIKSVVSEIVDHGRIRSRLMDFQVTTLNEKIASMLETDLKTGAVVAELGKGGPAEQAGLKVGDVISHVNNQEVKDADDLKIKIWSNQVGSRFRLRVDRGGKQFEADYVLVEPPAKK